MEDKKRKKEERKKKDAGQKVTEQKTKVPEVTKANPSQPPAASLIGSSPAPPANGGNNAKRVALPNGQPPSAPAQRYMPREVPPRFRCQQDHKVLLKRGQPPPPSCMLLGSGGPAPLSHPQTSSTTNPGDNGSPTDSNLGAASSSSAAASNYANSTWGPAAASTQCWDKVIVDGSDLEEWPSIAGKELEGGSGTVPSPAESSSSGECSIGNNPSASGAPTQPSSGLQQGAANSSSVMQSNECTQGSGNGGAWSLITAGVNGGGVAAKSKPTQSSSPSAADGTAGGNSGTSSWKGTGSTNFNPNSNPSAWPALVQDGCSSGGSVRKVGGELEDGACISSSGQSEARAASESPPAATSCLNPTTTTSVTTPAPSSSINSASHLHHQNPSTPREQQETEELIGWAASQEPAAGPKKGGNNGGPPPPSSSSRSDEGGKGEVSTALEDSSWRSHQPALQNKGGGTSRTDPWDNWGSSSGGTSWGYGNQDNGGNGGGKGGKAWGNGGGEGTKTVAVAAAVTQGVWGSTALGEDLSVGEWGAGGVPASSSLPLTNSNTNPSTTGAWDNQKGLQMEGGGQGSNNASGWGRSSSSAGSETGGQGSTGSNSRSGGGGGGGNGGHNSSSGGRSRGHHQRPIQHDPEAALQSMLSRTDLDPRVLSNSGWGQTQIRQNVAWDLDESRGGVANPVNSTAAGENRKVENNNRGTEGWESSHSTLTANPANLGTVSANPAAANSGHAATTTTCSSVANSAAIQAKNSGGNGGGWGGEPLPPGQSSGQPKTSGWGDAEWRERSVGGGPGMSSCQGGWGDYNKPSPTGTSSWGPPGHSGPGRGNSEDKNVPASPPSSSFSWKEGSKEGGWGRQGGSSNSGTPSWTIANKNDNGWGEPEPVVNKPGWRTGGEGKAGLPLSVAAGEMGSWGGGVSGGPGPGPGPGATSGPSCWDEPTGRGGWGESGGKQGGCSNWGKQPLSQTSSQHQDSAIQGSWGQPPGGRSLPPPQSWTSGPLPPPGHIDDEPSGWEEPSPQSISRKMDIDDGTSAWGDPSSYNYKNVNLWDKNSASLAAQPPPSQQPPPPVASSMQQQASQPSGAGQPPPRDVIAGPSSVGKTPGSVWNSSSPSGPPVDNGTAAWGKPTDTSSTWGDPEDTGKAASGWGNPSPNPANPVKPGSKSMQESWGESESSVTATRHPSWEEDEDGGVWNSAGSQGSNSSYNSSGWGQGGNKKANPKVFASCGAMFYRAFKPLVSQPSTKASVFELQVFVTSDERTLPILLH
uniref:Trinucleotide repeat containing adaptor 6B n=1 Tax=Erpetoichthys calabaricus TaxID=27687 RepID=A0A8C4SDR9_ERPCA